MTDLEKFKKLQKGLIKNLGIHSMMRSNNGGYCLDIIPVAKRNPQGYATHYNRSRFELIERIANQLIGSKGRVEADPKNGNIRITVGLDNQTVRRILIPPPPCVRPGSDARGGVRGIRRT